MPFTVKIDVTKATKGIKTLESDIKKATATALTNIAQSAVQGAQSTVPVDTGRLRDSIGVKEKTDKVAVVAADTEYAAAIEFGTSRMAARPYVGPEADRLETAASRMLQDEIDKVIRRSG